MEKIQSLSLDLETFSDVDLQKCGVYKYAQSPNFEILLFGVSVNGGEVVVYDLAQGDTVPMEIVEALTDDTVTKWAYNAAFERICLSVWLQRNYPAYFHSYSIDEDTVGDYLDPSAWKCSMIWAAYMGLPLSLAGAGTVLGFAVIPAHTHKPHLPSAFCCSYRKGLLCQIGQHHHLQIHLQGRPAPPNRNAGSGRIHSHR